MLQTYCFLWRQVFLTKQSCSHLFFFLLIFVVLAGGGSRWSILLSFFVVVKKGDPLDLLPSSESEAESDDEDITKEGRDPPHITKEGRDPPRKLGCLLYTSPSPRDLSTSRMPSSA